VADKNEWKLENAVTEKVSHEAMMADFQGSDVDDRFRKLLSMAKPIRWGFFHHLRTSIYYRGRVALLGDSAHASLPYQAAGAAQGLEDALILSSVLEKIAKTSKEEVNLEANIRRALDAYDSVRRPRAQKQLEQAYEVGRMIFFQHEEVGDDMAKILPRLQNNRFNWLWFHDMQDDVQAALSKMQQGKHEICHARAAIYIR